jgi:hypothetical protein
MLTDFLLLGSRVVDGRSRADHRILVANFGRVQQLYVIKAPQILQKDFRSNSKPSAKLPKGPDRA